MVVLHTFFTDETVERCLKTVREGAERAGRDPSTVRVWSCYATIHDGIPYEARLKKTVGRLGTYLQGYGDLLVETNRWDPTVLARFRADDVVASFQGALDAKADTATLEHVATLLPDEWFEPAATGDPKRCAERVLRQLDLGCDGVIMHGATPVELEPVVAAYRRLRPPGRFDALAANPGRSPRSA
jgi:alkanesulfonate monooxygenase SsuD/methylene tetrahydromethanopterin reductase-like flavin-dependent oxidoreductase (luciferase family)